MLIVIGVTGHHGSGKDTVAELLVKHFKARGFDAQRFGFADELKRLAKQYFDWDGNKAQSVTIQAPAGGNPPTCTLLGGRALLQGVGILMREEVDQEFWIQRCQEEIEKWAGKDIEGEDTCYAVISDVRFANELAFCQYVLKVNRPGCKGDGHTSETTMDTPAFMAKVTDVIQNDGDLNQLNEKVGRFVGGMTDG